MLVFEIAVLLIEIEYPTTANSLKHISFPFPTASPVPHLGWKFLNFYSLFFPDYKKVQRRELSPFSDFSIH